MICTNCYQRDVCPHQCKDDPLLVSCADHSGCWHFDRLRLERMTADRDALRAELDRTKGEMERVRKSQLRRLDRLADQRCDELLDLDAQDTQGDGFYWRWFGRMVAFRDACRAALERKADA